MNTVTEHTPSPADSGIDISEAVDVFKQLSGQLSQSSKEIILQRALSTTSSADSVRTKAAKEDTEKGKVLDEIFDLREYLTSSNEANHRAGIQHKHVGVTWENLQVDVIGGIDSKTYIGTLGDAVVNFFLSPLLWLHGIILSFLPSRETFTRTILHRSSGVLKPGEMCLVLGCPGSGCTTFLKTIANDRSSYANVSGQVLYAGMDAREMAKHYNGEVVYNAEADCHIPTLTVAQTLAFALSTKTPGPNGRLPGVSRAEFNEEILNTVLRMLNIQHTKQTLVGDEFVRGVSGGERKRVSIAEMMATRARVQCWDNSTRGLDASTAMDFVRSLRIMTDVLGQTTFVSLYQAGEGIYNLFDKVMVLDSGRQVYFGPASGARAYFENFGFRPLPRQSTADYLTGCTDPNERQFQPGRSAQNSWCTPEALEKAFLTSPTARIMNDSFQRYRLRQEIEKDDQEAFRAAVAADKKRGVSKRSPYTLGFIGQTRALTIRQFQMRLQDRFQLVTSFSLKTALAFVIGGAFFNQPLTSIGAFTRGSVLFTAILSTSLDAFGEMPMMMVGRPIMRKQLTFSLYRPSALAIANTLADLPFSATRVLIFDIIVYFMSNLNRSAGGFFTFHLFNYVAYLTMQGLFRTFGLLCANVDQALRLAIIFIPNIVEYCGYMIPVLSMKRWLFWIYYINPVAYAWAACMESEFMRISLTCDGNAIVPRNAPGMRKYPDQLGPNQACTLFGASSGNNIIQGSSYIRAGYKFNVSDLWRRNLVVLLGFFLLFQLIQVLVIEFYNHNSVDLSVKNIYAKESAEDKKRNEVLQANKAERNKLSKSEDISEKNRPTFAHKKSFTWEQLNYHVPVPGGTRRLLHDVQGYVKPGTLTALMGASGAGKTTCLDVLAQRKNIGVISGQVLVDGRPLRSDFACETAYAEQMDVHVGTSTVREAMRFSACLRQSADISQREKDDYVEEIITLLELQDLTEAMVSSLGLEARKRLTIGVELASKPELLMFLDEPTSGLDAQSAWNLVRFLRKLADQGQAILCTIHQPSAMLFESFDRLLLLEKGGETVYFGDIGSDSHVIRDYFERNGACCPPNMNPAEYMLEAIGAGVTRRVGDRDWKDIWLESPECQVVQDEISAIKREGLSRPVTEKQKYNTYATPFLYQLKMVVQRNNMALWRSPDYIFTRLFMHGFVSLWVSVSFLQLGHSLREMQYRVFSIFWIGVLPLLVIVQLEPIRNRKIFIRESSSRIYSPYVFAIGQLLGEIPYSLMCAVLYWAFMVYPAGFGKGTEGTNGTFFQLLIVICMELFGVTLGQMIASSSPSIQVAVLFNPFLGLTLSIFCGVTIPFTELTHFWKSWLYQLNPNTRAIAAMVSTELHGLVTRCKSDEFSVFQPPTGQTCQTWAQDFVNAFGGYLDNPDAVSNCRYCQFARGDEFYTPLNISISTRWRDAFLVFTIVIFNATVTIIASRFLRYAKR